jgi:hypothetical protein
MDHPRHTEGSEMSISLRIRIGKRRLILLIRF